MMHESPPAWFQKLLSAALNSRNRETIAGDLLEEYREERLPRLGAWRANFWYLRQIISIAVIRLFAGQLTRQLWILISVFTMAAGLWLTAMENVLKHSGYEGRAVTDGCIALQGIATLLFILLNGSTLIRAILAMSAAAIALLGIFAIIKVLRAPHFEGFVLLIGCALILQGGCTLAMLVSLPRYDPTQS